MPISISGDGSIGSLSATEIGYLDGVTSAVQTQIDNKLTTPGVWTSWTPTVSNCNVGNGTLSARYIQLGKLICFRFNFILGSTSSISGDFAFTPPPIIATATHTFSAVMVDAGINVYLAFATWVGTMGDPIYVRAVSAAGTYASFATTTATVPFTWGNTDIITCSGIYEAA
jgi:hypothetical protein